MIYSPFSVSRIRIAAMVISLSSFVAAILLVTTDEKAAIATFAAGAFFAFLLTAPPFWLALLLVMLIPFHSLIQELLGGFESNSRQLFALWKEVLLGIGIFRVFSHNRNRKAIIATNRWIFVWSSLLILVYCVTFVRAPSIPGIFSLNLETRFIGVMLFFMFLDFDEKQNVVLLRVMVWSVGLIAMYGLVQYAWDYERLLSLVYFTPGVLSEGTRRLYSFSLNPFDPAYGAMIAILVLFSGAGRSTLRIALPWFALLIPCLLLTYTRSAYLGLLAGIVAVCFVDRSHFSRHAMVVAMGLCLVCVILLFSGDAVYDSFLGQRLKSIVSQADDSSMTHKDSMERAMGVISSNPFGIGLGKYGTVQARFDGGVSEAEYTENWVFQVAVQTGVIGAIAYIALTGTILASLLRRRQCASKETSLLRASAAGVFVAMTVAGMMIPVWDDLVPVVYVWALVGMALQKGYAPRLTEAWASHFRGLIGYSRMGNSRALGMDRR